MSTGMLDPKFGTGGIAPLGFTGDDVAVDSAGRTVVVGGLNLDFAVLRLNPNGTPDTRFGTNGLVTTDFGGKKLDFAQRVAIQSDGKIVVAGFVENSGGVDHPMNGKLALARYNPDGSPDMSFGDGGKETVLGNLTSYGVGAIGIQSDGKIVFAADRQHDDNFDFITFRLQSNGALDGTFGDARGSGSAGYVNTGLGDQDMPSALIIQPDGNIVVGGTKDVVGGDELDRDEFALLRYTPAGKLDRSFDGDGILLARFIGDATLYAMTAQPDGKILAAGNMRGRDGRSHMLLTRFLNDGSVDNKFGTGTIVADATPGVSSTATNIFVRGGKIVIVGSEQASGQNANTFATQYLLNGSLDGSFGTDGVAHMNIAGGTFWPRAALAQDGKVVFAFNGGTTRGGVARFVEVVPQVYVILDGFLGIEGSRDGDFNVGRDAAYDFPTRVYINLRGTALYGKDYTTSMTIPPVPFGADGEPVKGLNGVVFDPPVQAYIDIPAGVQNVVVPVHVINDNQIEPTEEATFILMDNPNYARNPLHHDTTVTIWDDDDARIDFEAKGGTLKPGDRADIGAKFADRGNGLNYGWDVDNTANARNRANKRSPDPRYDSFNHMQKGGVNRKWEIAVPNGLYQVTIVAGDPNATDSIYRINVEGQLALSGIPGGDVHWFTRTMNIMVSDGRLTVTNGAGAVNNKIAYLEITHPGFHTDPGIVTPDTPIRLNPAPAKKPAKKAFEGFTRSFFPDRTIEETLIA